MPALAHTSGIYGFYKDNPFTKAYHHAVLAGQLLAIMIARSGLLNGNAANLFGFSLGSVFAYNTCLTLYDLGCRDMVGDVCLIGSTVDADHLAMNLHKLVGSKGVVQGKLTVCYTTKDNVLSYMFRSARFGESPIGLKKINEEYLVNCLRENDEVVGDMSVQESYGYLRMKFENVNVTQQVEGHMDYSQKLIKIVPGLDFNGDLQYFKERST